MLAFAGAPKEREKEKKTTTKKITTSISSAFRLIPSIQSNASPGRQCYKMLLCG